MYVSGNSATHGYPAWDVVCMDSEHLATAPVTGRVVFAQEGFPNNGCTGLANVVVIRGGGDGRFYVLGHLKRGSVRVERGDRIRHGQVVGVQGRSGQVTGEHVHIMRFADYYTYGEENCGRRTVWGNGATSFCFTDIGCPSTGSTVTSGNYPP